MGQMRTGAATGVAARHLSRADSAVVGLFGTGRHAMTQLEATCAVRPVREVKVHGRDAGRVQRFCDEMAARVNARLRPATDAADAVRDSDIVVAMTRADAPLFDGRLLEPGQFISAAGANALNRRELDLAAVRRAEVIVVDSVQVAEGECGDLLQAFEAGLLQWENVPTLGDVIVGRHPGR
ncbi:MAG: ornithine cyclodeaminase family protein, partial [bacterium]